MQPQRKLKESPTHYPGAVVKLDILHLGLRLGSQGAMVLSGGTSWGSGAHWGARGHWCSVWGGGAVVLSGWPKRALVLSVRKMGHPCSIGNQGGHWCSLGGDGEYWCSVERQGVSDARGGGK